MSRYSTLTNDPPLRRRHSLADKLISAPDARQRPPDPALQNRKLKLFGATNEKNRVEVIKKKNPQRSENKKRFYEAAASLPVWSSKDHTEEQLA